MRTRIVGPQLSDHRASWALVICYKITKYRCCFCCNKTECPSREPPQRVCSVLHCGRGTGGAARGCGWLHGNLEGVGGGGLCSLVAVASCWRSGLGNVTSTAGADR